MDRITVADFTRNGAPAGMDAFLETFNGEKRVDYIDSNVWAHCPEDNAGFGMSYAVDAGRTLVLRVQEV